MLPDRLRKKTERDLYLASGIACVCLLLVLNTDGWGQSAASSATLSPVTGESWLTRRDKTFNDTSMGKTGHLGPAPDADGNGTPEVKPASSIVLTNRAVLATGSDLYRFNCQGCHGASGSGAPPEIRSLINPVRATSAVMVRERLKNSGIDITAAQAGRMAAEARASLSQRLQQGGENMPAFGYLGDPEARSLTNYLQQLAGMPVTGQAPMKEPPLRVGELIVRSTCHICHDATGENPTSQELLQGAIPPLASLTNRTSQAAFIRKVTRGAPIRMGEPAMLQRGRMPVFDYLTEEEAADVYAYLSLYPPASGTESAAPDPRALFALTSAFDSMPAATRKPTEEVDTKSVLLMIVLGLIVALLIVAGLAVTVREFLRLDSQAKARKDEATGSKTEKLHVYAR